jgi:hypothetical protein
MLTWLKAILWDEVAARTAFVALLSVAGAFVLQPQGRPVHERLLLAAVAALGPTAAGMSFRPKAP